MNAPDPSLCCAEGMCKYLNDWYWQCLPGSDGSTSTAAVTMEANVTTGGLGATACTMQVGCPAASLDAPPNRQLQLLQLLTGGGGGLTLAGLCQRRASEHASAVRFPPPPPPGWHLQPVWRQARAPGHQHGGPADLLPLHRQLQVCERLVLAVPARVDERQRHRPLVHRRLHHGGCCQRPGCSGAMLHSEWRAQLQRGQEGPVVQAHWLPPHSLCGDRHRERAGCR
jgi:hypothetical protein